MEMCLGSPRFLAPENRMFDFYRPYEDVFAKIQLVLFMLGMGPGLLPRDFLEVFRKPYAFCTAYLCQLALVPVVAELLTRWFRLEGGYALGLILVSAMPGGTFSKVFTYLGRGNIPLSISLTFFGTLGTIFTVPLTLKLLAGQHVPEGFSVPVLKVIELVGLYLLTPMVLGMAFARIYPDFKDRFSKICLRTGFVVVVFMVICSMGSGQIKPFEPPLRVPGSVVVFCILSMQITMLPFRFMGSRADCFSAGIEATMRNMNLALLLKAVLISGDDEASRTLGNDTLYMILFFAAVAMIAGFPLSLNFRRMARNEDRKKQANA